MGRKRMEIDLTVVEDLAARGLTVRSAAVEMQLNPGTLAGKMFGDQGVKAAWGRGVERARRQREGPPRAGSPNEQKILDAIHAGKRKCSDLKRHTGLCNADFMTAIERLEVAGQIKSREQGMLTHYYLRDEEFPVAPL